MRPTRSLVRKLPTSWRRIRIVHANHAGPCVSSIITTTRFQKGFRPTTSGIVSSSSSSYGSSLRSFHSTPATPKQQQQQQQQSASSSAPKDNAIEPSYGPLGRRAVTETSWREACGGLVHLDRLLRQDNDNNNNDETATATIASAVSPKSVWHTACDKLGLEIPQYRQYGTTESNNSNNNNSNYRSIAVARIKSGDLPPNVYQQLEQHPHVGSHPDFDWIEVLAVGIASKRKTAEHLAALDLMALWKEATGDDRTLPVEEWPEYVFGGNDNGRSSTTGPNNNNHHCNDDDDYARYCQNLLESTRCSKIRYDHEHRPDAKPPHWIADAETYFGGRYYFSTSTTPNRSKAEAEKDALVGLLEQNRDTPLYHTAMAYKAILDKYKCTTGVSSPQVASLVVPRLSDPVLSKLHESMGYDDDDDNNNNNNDNNTNGGSIEELHRARKERHQRLMEDYETEFHERKHEKRVSSLQKNNNHNKPTTTTTTTTSKTLRKTETYNRRYHAKHNAAEFQHIQSVRGKLPIRAIRRDFLEALQTHSVVVVSGGTGSGKSTQCPQFILEDALANNRAADTRILVTQPRKIAAVGLADRVARERFKDGSVGYAVRFSSKPPRPQGGSIEYMTTGILLRRLIGCNIDDHNDDDSLLKGVSHVVIDEVHERDINTDFLLILFKDLLKTRPDLKLILMSATLDAESFGKYFSSSSSSEQRVPVLGVPAEPLHPVDLVYLEDILVGNADEFSPRLKTLASSRMRHNRELLLEELAGIVEEQNESDRRTILERALSYTDPFVVPLQDDNAESTKKLNAKATMTGLVSEIALHVSQRETDANRSGSILCFLPGLDEIQQCRTDIEEHCSSPELLEKITILPLHSSIPQDDQQRVFEKADPGTVKVILATNIAESSVTIDDVLAVVDSGLVKEMAFDASVSVNAMETNQTSKASATQRLGRAGRVAPGTCYRLFSRGDLDAMEERPTPEIQRTALEATCLQTCSMMEDSQDFVGVQDFLARAMDPPDEESVGFARNRLHKLGAISFHNETDRLTPLGRCLARLPLDPATGKMLVMGCVLQCLDPLLTAAACFGSKDLFVHPPDQRETTKSIRKSFGPLSDIFASVAAYNEFWDRQETDGWKSAKEWAYENHLSVSSLTAIKAIRSQLLKELYKARLVSKTKGGDDVDVHADCEPLVSAIWCTAFPENLAVRRRHNRGGRLRTSSEDTAGLHPSSVLFSRKPPTTTTMSSLHSSDWYLFREKVLTSQLFLKECSSVSPEQILLFGGYHLEQQQDHDDDNDDCKAPKIRAVLDGWIAVEGHGVTLGALIRARDNIAMVFEETIARSARKSRSGSNDNDYSHYHNRIIAGIRDLFDALSNDETSRIAIEEEDLLPSDDFHDYFLDTDDEDDDDQVGYY